MIPKTVSLEDFEMEEQPSYTHKMRLDDKRIIGYAENIEAVKQSAYKILGTERYQYVMYSWDYGLETLDLFGEPVSYVCPELERRITEALTCDDRIESVSNFEFDTLVKGIVKAAFTVHTVFGDTAMEKEVNI